MEYIYIIFVLLWAVGSKQGRAYVCAVCKQQATYLYYIFIWRQYRLKQLYRENAIYYIPVTDATDICILLLYDIIITIIVISPCIVTITRV